MRALVMGARIFFCPSPFGELKKCAISLASGGTRSCSTELKNELAEISLICQGVNFFLGGERPGKQSVAFAKTDENPTIEVHGKLFAGVIVYPIAQQR